MKFYSLSWLDAKSLAAAISEVMRRTVAKARVRRRNVFEAISNGSFEKNTKKDSRRMKNRCGKFVYL